MSAKSIHKVPEPYALRKALREKVALLLSERDLCPPLPLEELSSIAEEVISSEGLDTDLRGWLMVEVHNRVWRGTLASIPRERRLLLLPKCLRSSTKCQAEVDEIGLLCHGCGSCCIPLIQDTADSFGTTSIVAEGFTSAVSLIKAGVVDAVIGVSCLDSLEKAFPLLINNAVPGVAVPLNRDGCIDTDVDSTYVKELLRMESDTVQDLIDYNNLKTEIKGLFSPENLSSVMAEGDDPTGKIAFEWISGDGKRFRPFLLGAVYEALSGNRSLPQYVRNAAVAVECFHKASLVHDDIQDGDEFRYGKPTVHAAHGAPMAINVGDLLLGEGYRLLSGSPVPLVGPIAEAHLKLCKGQGMELEWSAAPRPFGMDFALEIFRLKTVPAFSMSLTLGMLCAEKGNYSHMLDAYSDALGTAYQILDDIRDFDEKGPLRPRPSAILALLQEDPECEGIMDRVKEGCDMRSLLSEERYAPALSRAKEKASELARQYGKKAIDSLSSLKNLELKRLLFRVTGKILEK
ncbi:MAG: polyprenyl synthetase family protein [Bacteroidales bacterium]|nr:polyprenyl synthetase family protein [Bacteroidales bacterium]